MGGSEQTGPVNIVSFILFLFTLKIKLDNNNNKTGPGGPGQPDVLRGGPARHHHAPGPGGSPAEHPYDDRQLVGLWP